MRKPSALLEAVFSLYSRRPATVSGEFQFPGLAPSMVISVSADGRHRLVLGSTRKGKIRTSGADEPAAPAG